jgi:hypothetical protein
MTRTTHRYARLLTLVFLAILATACLAQMQVPKPAPHLTVAWGPVLSDQRATSVAVGWATDIPSRCRVVCGGRRFLSASKGIYHRTVIAGLKPNHSYRYAVEAFAGAEKARSAAYEFRTPPAKMPRWSFIVFGDTRTNHDAHRSVVNGILRALPRPFFIVHTGDLVEEGNAIAEWDTFFDIERPILGTVPFYPCMGNHEPDSKYYYDLFPVPSGGGPHREAWYSFRRDNAVIIGLDTEREIEAQVAFLDAELTKAERDHVRWKFVFFHRPIYSSGSHGGSAEEQKAWAPVLVKHKVTAVFCGHDHLYEHSLADGVNYFTSGGGGAPLYAVGQKPNPYHVKGVSTYHFIQVLVRPTNVEIRVVRPNGVLIDRVVVK